jgi:inosine/xanthosine triphosphatase
MKVNIGTKNKIKIEALRETVAGYDFLKGAIVSGTEVVSGVPDQPQNIEATVCGAKKRAQNAFKDCDFAVGVEDGLMAVPGSGAGFMNVTAAAFYDGERFYLGLSAAFEYPPAVIRLVKEGLDINQAFYKMELTGDPKIGSAQGAVGILTKGRWVRKDTVKQALTAALVQLENKSLFAPFHE